MRYVFRRFNRSQKAIGETKDRIAVTLVQDLKSCYLSVRGLFQQPFVCSRVRQSKRSILQEKLPTALLLLIAPKLRKFLVYLPNFFAGGRLYSRLPLFRQSEPSDKSRRSRALMPLKGLRLTRLCATSKLFFAASQRLLKRIP